MISKIKKNIQYKNFTKIILNNLLNKFNNSFKKFDKILNIFHFLLLLL